MPVDIFLGAMNMEEGYLIPTEMTTLAIVNRSRDDDDAIFTRLRILLAVMRREWK